MPVGVPGHIFKIMRLVTGFRTKNSIQFLLSSTAVGISGFVITGDLIYRTNATLAADPAGIILRVCCFCKRPAACIRYKFTYSFIGIGILVRIIFRCATPCPHGVGCGLQKMLRRIQAVILTFVVFRVVYRSIKIRRVFNNGVQSRRRQYLYYRPPLVVIHSFGHCSCAGSIILCNRLTAVQTPIKILYYNFPFTLFGKADI